MDLNTLPAPTNSAGKINRYEAFHHYRHEHPEFYDRFESAALQVLLRTEGRVHLHAFFATLYHDYSASSILPDGTNVQKPLLVWLRRNNPEACEGRFRHRKTEKARAKTTPERTDYWRAESRKHVDNATLWKLADRLIEDDRVTTMSELKVAAGVKFNQNFNFEVAETLRNRHPHEAHLLPARRPRVR